MNQFRVSVILIAQFLLSGFLLCLPLVLNWKSHNLTYVNGDIPEYFEDAMKYAIAAAIPLIIDSMIDMSFTSLFRPFRVILLLAVTIPNFVFILCKLHPAVYFVSFQLRYMICACICYLHLFLHDEIFRRWHFIVLTVVGNLTTVIYTWSSFTTTYLSILVALYYVSLIIGFIMFSYYVGVWVMKVSKLRSCEVTNDDRRCGAYIFSMGIVGVSFIFMAVLYGPYIVDKDIYPYVTTCTYISLVFTVSIWLLHGRIIRLEVEQAKVWSQSVYMKLSLFIYVNTGNFNDEKNLRPLRVP